MLDHHRNLRATPWQWCREHSKRHIPVLLRPRGVSTIRVYPRNARVRPDRGIHLFVGLAIGETGPRPAAVGRPLQLRGVLFEALANRIELGRVERFRDLGLPGRRIEYVRPACPRVLLLEVQREQAVGVRAVRVPRPEARGGRDAAPQARGRVAREVEALDEYGERLGGEVDVDVALRRARGERERYGDLLGVLRPGIGWRWRLCWLGRKGIAIRAGYGNKFVRGGFIRHHSWLLNSPIR